MLPIALRALVVISACLLLARAGAAADPLGPLAGIAKRYKLPARSISAWVQEVASAQPLLAINPRVPRNPASTLKLLTTFVALDILGPIYAWPTEVYALGPLKDGVLEGDLLLKGFGDPYLLEENLWKLLGELRRTGLQHIRGDLVIDDSHFAPPLRDPGAFDGQAFRLYNVLPNAMMVNFKAVTLVFAPRADGRGVSVRTRPELPNLKIINQLQLERGGCRGVLASVKITVPEPAVADAVVLSGRYQTGCGEQTLPRTFMTSADYAYGLFRNLWAQWGGTLDGGVRRGLQPMQARPLMVWHSPPLAELIRPLNKWSNNVMADALFYTLGGTLFEPPLMPVHGATVIESYLKQRHIPTDGFVMENGSGLSRVTRLTALTLHEVLRYAYRSKYMPEYLASLSILGVDGTLRRRLQRSPETGWMHLKSGHLNNVAAVAGYVRAQSGKTYVVVLFVNGSTGGAHALFDTFLQWVYRH